MQQKSAVKYIKKKQHSLKSVLSEFRYGFHLYFINRLRISCIHLRSNTNELSVICF
jgi:hypothetical protein